MTLPPPFGKFFPTPGQPDQIILDSFPMQLVPGKYSIEEADRFGEKVSQGTLKYADFNPYESAHAVAAFTGGSGLRRYSDAGDDPTKVATLYKESSNVNCCFAPAVLSPEILYETLPGCTGACVWLGEAWLTSSGGSIDHQFIAVGPVDNQTGVWQRQGTNNWQQRVVIPNGTALEGAITVYKNVLILGFGMQRLAVGYNLETGAQTQIMQNAAHITQVTNPTPPPATIPEAVIDAPVPMYVWAATADKAEVVLAGGSQNTDWHYITSSIFPDHDFSMTWNPDFVGLQTGIAMGVDTGDTRINSLAPGGGLVAVYVGKTNELGMVDLGQPQNFPTGTPPGTFAGGVYHSLIPFDSNFNTNCLPMKWLLASGADQQRGSLTLVFPREHALWEYAPADQFSGTATNISPWAIGYRRPPHARGLVTAIQGTARWLYYAVQNGPGHTWIYRNDQTTGAPHTYLDLDPPGDANNQSTDVRAMATSTIFGSHPLLFFSAGNQVANILLPLDGDSEVDDPACRYQLQGYIDIPDIDLGFPDEDKIGFTVRVISDNLSPGHRYHRVQYIEDGIGGYADLNFNPVNVSPGGEVDFPLQNVAKRISLRIWFYTDDPTQSPQLWGFSLRVALNTKVYRLFVLQVRMPADSFTTLADDLQNPYMLVNAFWFRRRRGFPIPYTDPWNDHYLVRIIKMQQQQALREPDKTPEWVVDFTLLEFYTDHRPSPTMLVLDGNPASVNDALPVGV